MIDDLAPRAYTTSPIARVGALHIHTSLAGGALSGHHALWPAAGRSPGVRGKAGTHGVLVDGAALRVGTAWGGVARVSGWERFCRTEERNVSYIL